MADSCSESGRLSKVVCTCVSLGMESFTSVAGWLGTQPLALNWVQICPSPLGSCGTLDLTLSLNLPIDKTEIITVSTSEGGRLAMTGSTE